MMPLLSSANQNIRSKGVGVHLRIANLQSLWGKSSA